MKETNRPQLIQGTLAAVPTEVAEPVFEPTTEQGIPSPSVSVIAELESNLEKVEELTSRLGFMMREVSYVLNKKI